MPVLPPWAQSVCVSLCVRKCVRVSSLLLTLACRCAKIIKRTRVGHSRMNRETSSSRSLSTFSHIHAPACIRILIHMRSAALTSTWVTNSQTTFNEEPRTSHCHLRMIGSVGRRTWWFHLVLNSSQEKISLEISLTLMSPLIQVTKFLYCM